MTTTVQLYIGDDWTFLIPVTNPDTTPTNFTTLGLTPGGELWLFTSPGPSPPPQDLTIANGGVTVIDPVNGLFSFFVSDVVTRNAIALTQPSKTVPNRIQAFVTDAQGRRTTLGLIYIIPLDPRTA